VNFTTAMPDANYAVNITASQGNQSGTAASAPSATPATGSVQVITWQPGTLVDASFVSVSIFR